MTTRTFEKINDIFQCKLILEDDSEFIIPLREDGYIFATGLCQVVKKRVFDWLRLKETKDLTKILSVETGILENKLIEICKGGNNKKAQGTWVHRMLATNLGQWCSIYFSLQISKWIEEWCVYNKDNEIKYLTEIYNIQPDNLINNIKELEIQKKLQQELGGEIEVQTDVGFIDLLTNIEIIEIKNGNNWKHAVGQILMYSLEYPNHIKRIHLFDIYKSEIIERCCKKYDIKVTYEI
jgi:hypothetical protein